MKLPWRCLVIVIVVLAIGLNPLPHASAIGPVISNTMSRGLGVGGMQKGKKTKTKQLSKSKKEGKKPISNETLEPNRSTLDMHDDRATENNDWQSQIKTNRQEVGSSSQPIHDTAPGEMSGTSQQGADDQVHK